jgi:heme-degrading monooxygenase HmoA
MFARVSILQGEAASAAVDKAVDAAKNEVLPAAQQMQGFQGMMALGDSRTGRVVAITFWASEDDLRQSEDAANRLRESAADSSSADIAEVDRFEVLLNTMQ